MIFLILQIFQQGKKIKRIRETGVETLSSAKRKKSARNHKTIRNEPVTNGPQLNGQYVLSRKMCAYLEKKAKRGVNISGRLTNVWVIFALTNSCIFSEQVIGQI